jgi:hypothetical protein
MVNDSDGGTPKDAPDAAISNVSTSNASTTTVRGVDT